MRKYIVANWKMNKTIGEAVDFAKKVKAVTLGIDENFVICPTNICLKSVADELKNSKIKVGAQNCYKESHGAYTGEVSPAMIKDAGCDYVIIGHSERRQIFGETDELVNQKIKLAIENGLNVILCIGETLEQKENYKQVLKAQLQTALDGVDANGENLIIAYEPVWAIGTGKVASIEDIKNVHAYIKQVAYNELKYLPPVLYGGSVKPNNAKEILELDDVDGVLIGGASLDVNSYVEIATRR